MLRCVPAQDQVTCCSSVYRFWACYLAEGQGERSTSNLSKSFRIKWHTVSVALLFLLHVRVPTNNQKKKKGLLWVVKGSSLPLWQENTFRKQTEEIFMFFCCCCCCVWGIFFQSQNETSQSFHIIQLSANKYLLWEKLLPLNTAFNPVPSVYADCSPEKQNVKGNVRNIAELNT